MGHSGGTGGAALRLPLTPFLQLAGVGVVQSRCPAVTHIGGRCMSAMAQRPLATGTSIKAFAWVPREALNVSACSQLKVIWVGLPLYL
jgi:hypothetical protein